jgi:hypothetical protein
VSGEIFRRGAALLCLLPAPSSRHEERCKGAGASNKHDLAKQESSGAGRLRVGGCAAASKNVGAPTFSGLSSDDAMDVALAFRPEGFFVTGTAVTGAEGLTPYPSLVLRARGVSYRREHQNVGTPTFPFWNAALVEHVGLAASLQSGVSRIWVDASRSKDRPPRVAR